MATPAPGAIVFWGLMALVALAPLPFGANRPWAWSLVAAVTGLLLLLWVLAAWRTNSLVALSWSRHGFLTIPFLCVIAWALVQAAPFTPEAWHHPLWRDAARALRATLNGAISLDPGATTEAAMRLASYGAGFFLAMQFGRDPARARQALWAVALAGTAYAIYGLAIELGGEHTVLGYPKAVYTDSLTATFINRNAYAVQAGLGLLAILGLLAESVRGSGRYSLSTRVGFAGLLEELPLSAYVLLAAAVTVATALVMTRSRGGLGATAAAIVVLAFALALRRDRAREGLGLGLGTLAGGLLILAVSGSVLWERVVSGLGQSSGRAAVHALTREAALDRPWLGHGLGTFDEIFRLYRDQRFPWIEPAYRQAHSTYLELAAELGIPAAAVLIAVVAAIAALCAVGAFRRRRARIYPCLGLAATALVGLQALFDFAIQMPAVAITYLTLAGVGFAQSYRTDER